MSQSKRTLQYILSLPSSLATGIFSSESDWVRYGLPAVLLTAIFFFAMRFQSGDVQTQPVAPPAPKAKPHAVAAKTAPQAAPAVAAAPPVANLAPPQRPPEPRRLPLQPPAAVAIAPPAAPGTQAMSVQEKEGRKALCNAVEYAVGRLKKRRRKVRALEMAFAAYRGPGGPQAAQQAVNAALQSYGAGSWDEAQCPTLSGTAPLPKGAIAEVMR